MEVSQATAATATPPTTDTNDNVTTSLSYHLLVEFAYQHVDFQMAELASVLRMNGIVLASPQCRIVPLINQHVFAQTQAAFAGTAKQLTGGVRRPFVLLALDATLTSQKAQQKKVN